MASLEKNYGYIVPPQVKSRIYKNTTVNVSELTKTFIICDAQALYDNNLFMNNLKEDLSSDKFDAMLMKPIISSNEPSIEASEPEIISVISSNKPSVEASESEIISVTVYAKKNIPRLEDTLKFCN